MLHRALISVTNRKHSEAGAGGEAPMAKHLPHNQEALRGSPGLTTPGVVVGVCISVLSRSWELTGYPACLNW